MAAVIEAPRMNNQCLARGAVAIVSIDPVASVAALEDEQATLEAAALPRGKYMAIADTLSGFDWSKPIYDMPLGLSFFCVGRGLPEPPSASLALGPDVPLGNDRPPLVVAPPLPWPDCYVYTLHCFYARISRVYPCTPPTAPTVATKEQWVTINRSVTKDQMSANLPLRDAYGEPVEVPDDEYDTDNEPSYDVESCIPQGRQTGGDTAQGADVAVEDGKHEPGNVEAFEEQLSGIDQADSEIVPTQDPGATWPQLEAWLDLTSATEFDQPAALLHTLRRLTIIVHESKRRRVVDFLAKRPRTMQWADAVAAADGAADLARPNDTAAGQVVEDVSISPDDAIEHRQERAAAQAATVSNGDPTSQPAKKRSKLSLIGAFEAARRLLRRPGKVVTCTADPR
ncbi:hypothetical protein AURDEDRAFT_185037 [Auricularia subglabra TFB-10046 SS5]|nr:hypothetical protein AURDEDRAFT_185037 [Auricularia subglabra TFB-10046 SS5]